MSDPVAENSGFLSVYMSRDPDTLVGYAKWYGKVSEVITSAEMTAIDSKSMTLACTLTSGTKQTVVVDIHPPLTSYEEVKSRLLEMKAISQEGLGMIISPKITSFQLPSTGMGTAALLFGFLPYSAFCPDIGSPICVPAQFLHSWIGPTTIQILFGGIVVVHIAEAMYAMYLCRKHKAGALVTVKYMAATFFMGYVVWQDLRKRIQSARINSVMRME
ncbi:hypothetical protein C8J57DRAFT_1464489 [Mycena rebaudengoi]|nr:hypothetical protein C8J57DRAFT_1464489 [Mycena rebaudengoi]